jgi:hypothetical protein
MERMGTTFQIGVIRMFLPPDHDPPSAPSVGTYTEYSVQVQYKCKQNGRLDMGRRFVSARADPRFQPKFARPPGPQAPRPSGKSRTAGVAHCGLAQVAVAVAGLRLQSQGPLLQANSVRLPSAPSPCSRSPFFLEQPFFLRTRTSV